MHKDFFVSFMYNNEEGGVTWGNTVICYEDWEGERIQHSTIMKAEEYLAKDFKVDKVHIMGIIEIEDDREEVK